MITDHNEMNNPYRGPSVNTSYQVSVHLVKWFHRRRFLRNQPIRKKNCLWRPCLITDRNEMSNLYRGPSIDTSYQVSVHLAERFQRKIFFLHWPIRKKNCMWWPCLLTDRDKMSNLYRGPSIDTSYQVLVHLAKRFQRRRFKTRGSGDHPCHVCFKLADWFQRRLLNNFPIGPMLKLCLLMAAFLDRDQVH